MNAEKLPLSVAIITKNEEERLPDCLKSVSFAEEIVVVDSGSTDRTIAIAEGFGCRVFVEDWKGYGPQKNSAVQKCSREWVLLIDADERIAPETAETIPKVLEHAQAAAYSFRRKNYLHGRWLKHSGYWPDRQVRLVRKSEGQFVGEIHERWETAGPVRAPISGRTSSRAPAVDAKALVDHVSTALPAGREMGDGVPEFCILLQLVEVRAAGVRSMERP